VTVTAYPPTAVAETTKDDPDTRKPVGLIRQIADAGTNSPDGLEDMVQSPTSAVLKNGIVVFSICTVVPDGPDGGDRVIPGNVIGTMKVVLAKSPVGIPVTLM
jgi:hypothetical protein